MQSALGVFVITAPLLLVTPSIAQRDFFNINADESAVSLASNLTSHNPRTTFHVEKGWIAFDSHTGTMSGAVLLAALATNDYASQPGDNAPSSHRNDITFAPKTYQGFVSTTGASLIEATAIITYHGVSRPITVPMQIQIQGPNWTAQTSFSVPAEKHAQKSLGSAGDPTSGMQINVRLLGTIGSSVTALK